MAISTKVFLQPDTCKDAYSLSSVELYQLLRTSEVGLTQAEANRRLGEFGRNVISKVSGKPLWVKFLANFTHLMALLLWAGGAMGFIAHMPQLGCAIWTVNLINGAFSFWQEFKAEKAAEMLQRLLPNYSRVLRDGQEQRILAEELIPGDILLLAEGERISADGRLVQVAELQIDQSTLTGESQPVRKTSESVETSHARSSEIANLVFAGTSVAVGSGKAVVLATGMQTEFGRISHLTQSVGEAISPLQKELSDVTRIVTLLAVTIGTLFFILATVLAGVSMTQSFLFAMGMIVAFVPEGMLPTVTLALALGVQRMARRNALVKKLSAVETLGCTTVICTDKTGTLTQNEMTVHQLWVAGQLLTVTGVGYKLEGEILQKGQPLPEPATGDLRQMLLAASLCNNAHLLPQDAERRILGDSTEAALQVVACKAGLDVDQENRFAPRLYELPFDANRKRMSTIHQLSDGQVAYVKGAPSEILALCTHVRMHEQDCPLTEDLQSQIQSTNDHYASHGLRVLALAQRFLAPGTPFTTKAVECKLTFLGLVAMMDPPRAEVREAIAKCHRAGIRIVMITGDYGLTAQSVARRIGMITTDHAAILNGTDLDALDATALEAALQGEVIVARATPEHKLRVVDTLRRMGNIVAVTGDGVNDAPALKKADIGIAMGITGTDVAKEAADMILTDDNFASIVNAIEEGRTVYANIKKFISYMFTSNTTEAVPFIFFAFSRGQIPLALGVMQVISIDLGTDIMPALALGVEPPEPGLMDRPPRKRDEHVMTWPLNFRSRILLGIVQSLVAMAAFYFTFWTHGYWGQWLNLPTQGALYQMATTMTLATVVATQIGNLFANRTERASVLKIGLFTNPIVWLGIVSEVVLILLLAYVPFFQQTFGTAPLPPENWLFLLLATPILLIVDEIYKTFLRSR
jgi:P-type Ca2+ transporter type 2C